MKIVHILGGLGNQMFQYAFALALKEEFPDEEIRVDIHSFHGYNLHNGYEIERIFGKHIMHASILEISKVSWPLPHYRLWQLGNKILPLRKYMIRDKSFPSKFDFSSVKNYHYFIGYWGQSKFFEKYRNQIIKIYTFPEIKDSNNLKAKKFIEDDKTAFIHVRRGDYINHPTLGNVCSLNYYSRAIDLLCNHYNYCRFIIFSNDIKWCKNAFKDILTNKDILYVDWNKGTNSYRDMHLMSLCNAGIIANSSFSYWGAWLADAEVIVRPDKWTVNSGYLEDIILPNWITIRTD